MKKAILTKTFDLKFATAVSIIIGTSIGAGMLALPVQTAQAGFFPSVCLFLLTWVVTILTGLLFTEVILFNSPNSNYISLGKNILGKKFTYIIFALYILLFYSLIAAYTKGIGIILSTDLSLTSTPWNSSLLFVIFFLPLMYSGTHLIGRVNGFLTLVLLVSFLILISIGNKAVNFNFLKQTDWTQSLFSLPLLISSFGFHGTLPSLVDYLERDKTKIYWAIVIGSTVTLAIYLSWELLILGSVPLRGEISLISAWENDQTAISPLSQLSKSPYIWNLAHIFSLTAIITSFFGVSIGLIDFLVDAFRIKKTFFTKTALLTALYISALLLSMTELRIFYLSLNYGAGLAAIFLLVFLPAYMMKQLSQKEERGTFIFSRKIAIPMVFIFSAISVIACIISFFF